MAETTGTTTTTAAPKKKKVSQRITDQFVGTKTEGAETRSTQFKSDMDRYESQLAARDAELKDIRSAEGYQQPVDMFGNATNFDHKQMMLQNDLRKAREGYNTAQSDLADPTRLLDRKERDLIKGAEFGESVLGEEGLGRLGTDPEIAAAMARTKKQSEQGLSAEEFAAQRSKAFEGIDRSTQTSLRGIQARLAKSGVKGSVAGRQLVDAEMQGASQKSGVERDLFLESAKVKREEFSNYKQSLGDVKSFDLGQQAKETDIVLQSGLGFAQMGSAEKIAEMQAEAQRQAAVARSNANSCWAAGTQIVMKNGGIKAIEKLELGDETEHGKVEGLTKHLVPSEVLVSIDDILVVGTHPIFEVDTWIESKDSCLAVNVEMDIKDVVVYDIIVPGNRVSIYSNGHEYLFTDYNGHDMKEENDRLLEELNNVAGISKREVR